MVQYTKKIIATNVPLKIISLISGCIFWYFFGNNLTITMTKSVPLSFYGLSKDRSITAPDQVQIELAGKRSLLYSLHKNKLAIHIDASQLQSGNQIIRITPDELFLPDAIKLVHYEPSLISITVTEKKDLT